MKNFMTCMVAIMALAHPVAVNAEEAAPAGAHQAAPGLISGNARVLVGSVGTSPDVFGALALDGGVLLGLGAGVAYDGTKKEDKTSAFGFVYFAYMLKNTPKLAMGPELTVQTSFAPTAADTVTFVPGVCLWYLPWSVPIVVGSALDFNVSYKRTDPSGVSFSIITPGLRLGYIW